MTTRTARPTTCHEAALKAMAPDTPFDVAFRVTAQLDGDVNYSFDPVASRRMSAGAYERGLRVSILLKADGSVTVTHWDQAMWSPAWVVTVDDAWPVDLAERAIELAITYAVMEEYGRR